MAAAANPAPAVDQKVKPPKPDEEAFKSSLAAAEKEHSAVQEKLNQIKAKIETAKPHNQDSPTAKRQQELQSELSSIRQKQQGFKASRSSTQEKINALDSTLKARLAEQNNSRSRMSFKNVEDIDREIARLEKQVDSGTMRLVDEKKALSDVSTLRKQRKNFAGLNEGQKVIDDLKAQIASLRKTLDTPEAKALSERYTEIQKELDAIKAEKDSVFKNLNSLRDERTKLQGQQREKWSAIKEIKDKYYQGRRAYKEYEDEAWRVRREKAKAQRDAIEHEKKRKVADKKLEEASQPAYSDEIFTAQGLIRHFNPSYDFAALGLDDKKDQGSNFRAGVGRTVDDSDMKGVKIVKKEDREDDYFVGTGGKKGKKGKKGGNANAASGAPAENKFNMNIGIIEEFAKIKVDPPMNQADVPAVVEKLAEKITEWKKNQASKTEENIAKAKEEIAKLENETSQADQRTTDDAKKPAQQHSGVNGKASAEAEENQEKDAAADAAEDLQKASLEDKA
ncbi:hypothetical protein SI65_05299 [Aspergillus cristatus]|uniref:Nuclear segregation protein n=1 Tax=Aspergillus cristatus TaxID=573508 RepID=A0A1E3BCJ0_ASPCR|nr:hypothetical protein SI65_05299 [Aspergillus cristatus]